MPYFTSMSPAELAAGMLDVELSKRYNLLKNIVDEYEWSGEASSVEMKVIRNRLRMFERTK